MNLSSRNLTTKGFMLVALEVIFLSLFFCLKMYILIKEIKGTKPEKGKHLKMLRRLFTQTTQFFHFVILTLCFLCMFECFVIVFTTLHKKCTILILKFNSVM